jgi:hypothetical protein
LLTAALTLLSAYCAAGKPDQGLKPWGSYEGWSELVRGAVAWAGLPDPGQCRMTLVDGADRDAALLQGLVAGWRELDPEGQGLTIKQVGELLSDPMRVSEFPTMREVLAEWLGAKPGKPLDLSRLPYKLRAFSRRSCGGFCFYGEPSHGGVMRWTVREVAGSQTGGGGDGGDGGDAGPNPTRASAHKAQNASAHSGSGENRPHHPHHPHQDDDPWREMEDLVL